MRLTDRLQRPVFQRIWRAMKLDAFFYRQVAQQVSLTREAVSVGMVSVLLMGLGLALVRVISPIWWLVGGLAWATVVLAGGSWFFVFAGRRLGSSVQYDQMVRALGYAVAPQALGFLPFFGFVPGFLIGGLWTMACVVVAVRELHEIPTRAALALVVAPLFMIVAFIPLIVTAAQSGA